MAFAKKVTAYFKGNDYNDFVTKFGSARLGDLIRDLESSAVTVFAELMVDRSLDMIERLQIFNRAPDDLKVKVYDLIKPLLCAELQGHQLGSRVPCDKVLPEPPGLELHRQRQLQAEEDRRARESGQDDRSPGVERR